MEVMEVTIAFTQELFINILMTAQIFEWIFMLHIIHYQKDKETPVILHEMSNFNTRENFRNKELKIKKTHRALMLCVVIVFPLMGIAAWVLICFKGYDEVIRIVLAPFYTLFPLTQGFFIFLMHLI